MGSRFQSGVTRHLEAGIPGDRRRSCRYRAFHRDGQIGWWQNSVFEQRQAELIDISMNGARVSTDSKPGVAIASPIWYRPIGTSNDEWIEAVLVSMAKPWLGKCRLGINFSSSFGYETFKAIVYGKPGEPADSQRDVPEHEMHHFWK